MARTSFKFRLQRLLEIRVMREKQAQQELQVRRFMLQQEEQKLVVLQQEELALVERMTLRPGQVLDVREQQLCAFAIEQKVKEQDSQRRKITKAEQRVEEQQEAVKQAGIAVKALEKLREKQLAEHREEQLREEAVFLDDLSGQQFIRQKRIKAELLAEEALLAESASALEALEALDTADAAPDPTHFRTDSAETPTGAI